MYEPASCSLNDRKNNGNEDLFDFPLFFSFHWAISCKFLELFQSSFFTEQLWVVFVIIKVFLWCAEMFYENLEDRRAKRDKDRERKKLEITIIWCLS